MLEHEIDAVMVVTPAFKHASDAIAALNAGKHVLSEVTACWTMAEAVALYEAAKRTCWAHEVIRFKVGNT